MRFIDIIGEIHPFSSGGHRFILVGIDYFTKWIEVIPLSNVDEEYRGGFLISSYWLALTHNFKFTTELLFFSNEKGKSSNKPYIFRD